MARMVLTFFNRSHRRRGTVIAQVTVSTTVLLGFAALAVDVGQLFSVEAELQRAADSSALAGASGYFTNAGLVQDTTELNVIIPSRTQEYSLYNETYRAGGTAVELADITYGTYDFSNPNAALDTSGASRFNAVQVTTRRTAGGSNGAVGFFFARIFGMAEGEVTAKATAAMDDRVAGYDYDDSSGTGMLPFTVHVDIYNDMVVNGLDDYSYDNGNSEVVAGGSDGVPEVKLFPYKLSGAGNNNVGAGNFGTLQFGASGVDQVRDNITYGVTEADMEAAMGTSEPIYYDDEGNAQTYNTSGEPGMMAGVESAVDARVGDIVTFFLHDLVTESGENAIYRNVGIRAGRVMHIDLHGAPNSKELIIQPVAFTGGQVIVSASAPSTNGQMGRLMLVK